MLRRLSSTMNPRLFRIDGSFAVAEGRARGSSQGVSPLNHALPTLSAAVAADIVRLGRPDQKLRARAFYEDAGVSLVVHGRLRVPWPYRSVLHRGASIQRRIGPASGFALSRPLDRGRGWQYAWLVEESLQGRHLDVRAWQDAMPQVLEGLARLWLSGGVQHVPMERVIPRRSAASLLAMVEQWSDLEVDGPELAENARRLLAGNGLVAWGWCHGDPVRSNFLLLPDGRLALVDWESASRRALAHDATKTMIESADPRAHADAVASLLGRANVTHDLPWHDQMAVALLARLEGSRRRGRRARVSGQADLIIAKRRRDIRLLASLLIGRPSRLSRLP